MCQASAIISGVQSGLSWGSMALSLKGQYDEMKFKKDVAEKNARILDQSAQDSIDRGEAAAQVRQIEAGQLEGAQRTSLASAGVDLQSGSSLDIIAHGRALAALDEQTLRNNAAREAWGYRVKATEVRTQSLLDQKKAWNQSASTMLGELVRQGDYGKSFGGSFGK